MAFGFLLVLAGGFLVLATAGAPHLVGLVLLAAGVGVGAVALRGARDRTRQSTTTVD